MTPVSSGAQCDRCNFIVVDFTNRSDEYIRSVFLNSKERICGRMYADQLNRPLMSHKFNDPSFSLRAVALGLTLLSFPLMAKASEFSDASSVSLIEMVQNEEAINVNAPTDSLKRFLVVDGKGGLPIPLARVLILDKSGGVIGGLKTDFDGYAHLNEFSDWEMARSIEFRNDAEGYRARTFRVAEFDFSKSEIRVELWLDHRIKPIIIGQIAPVPKSIQRKQKRARKKEQRRQDSAAHKNSVG